MLLYYVYDRYFVFVVMQIKIRREYHSSKQASKAHALASFVTGEQKQTKERYYKVVE